ncbi:unnamed protein product, partial [Ectocarpus sp. 12 AP-2014]
REAARRQQQTPQATEARRAAARERAAAARAAARYAERARREREANVKRRDLAEFHAARPPEKLGWARLEMQTNFQQTMTARRMHVCTVCSERWDTAEDGPGDGGAVYSQPRPARAALRRHAGRAAVSCPPRGRVHG